MKWDRYVRHVDYIKSEGKEIIQEAEQNRNILQEAKSLSSHVQWAEYTLMTHQLKDILYGDANLEFRIFHHGYVLGSCSVNLAVLGWVMSEYNAPATTHGTILTVKWSGGLSHDPKDKVDPDFIGANYRLIVKDIHKEIV